MTEQKDTAGIIAPPPLIYFGFLILGLVINFIAPISFLPPSATLIVGIPLIFLGFVFGALAFVTMARAETSPDPWEPTKAIVTTGPFGSTRNPIYVSFTLIYLGVAAAMNALAALVLLPIALLIVHYGVILREEKYLERRFGEEYLRYRGQVRRWI